MKHLFSVLFPAFLLLLSCQGLRAQQGNGFVRSFEAGALYSVKGCGLSFVFPFRDGGTGEARILADFERVLRGHEAHPGTRIQFFRNFILQEIDVAEDLTLHLFGGPGLTAGLVRDRGKEAGYLMALSVGGGADLLFRDTPVTVSASFSADLGAHLIIRNQYDNTMTLYQNGWLRAWYPEVSVKYRF